MSFEEGDRFDYPEYDKDNEDNSNSGKGKRRPGLNEKRQERKNQIAIRRQKSGGNSNTVPGTDAAARSARSGGRRPGAHNNLGH